MHSDREAVRRDFLFSAGLADARRQPLAGDASTRRYERLFPVAGPSLILMDQPPAVETQPCPPSADAQARAKLGSNALERLAAGRVDAFVACAEYLSSQGLSAPQIVATDAPLGLAVLEDLGDGVYARVIEGGGDETPLYDAAVDVLVNLHNAPPPPSVLPGGWPLLDYDELALKTAGSFFVEWAPKLIPALSFSDQARAEWDAVWAPIRKRGAAGASVFCHRDYHAENLLWLPDRGGVRQVGLLDFQDALRAHPAWDLSMLLHDARRQVTPERESAVLKRYLQARPDLDPEAFRADYQALGALNIVRILGKFARLIARDGKPRYADFMPRMWGYLDRCLIGPAPAGLAQWLATHAPAEVRGGHSLASAPLDLTEG